MSCLECFGPLLKRTQKKYCSLKCASISNNRLYQKRFPSKDKFCDCGRRKEKRARHCIACKREVYSTRTLADALIEKYKDSGNRWNQVRKQARIRMEQWKVPKVCSDCGWEKHVEVIHVKGITTFPLNTLLVVVNSKENLKYLCPNCHWVFDYGHKGI